MEYPLFYNKDIFDRFGIPYPNDGMTWNEVIELAHKVTGEINGVHYIGLDITDDALMRFQLSATILDPQSGRASMNNEKWNKIAQTIKRIYEIKGNFLPERNKTLRLNRFFVRDKIIAMGVVCPSCFNHSELDFNWDMVSYPVYEDLYGPNLWNSLSLAISPTCKNKDAAFEIITYLVSDEFQSNNCKNGILTSLNKREVQQHFGENVPIYQNKNIQALFYCRPAIPEPRSPGKIIDQLYELFGKINSRLKFVDMIYENKSVDETLQELELEINKAIQDDLP